MSEGETYTPTQEDVDELRQFLREQEGQQSSVNEHRNVFTETDNPDDAAYDLRKSNEMGIPREAIGGAREQYRLEDSLRELEAARARAPKTSAWLAEPGNYAVAREDTKGLSAVEDIILGMLEYKSRAGQGVKAAPRALYNNAELAGMRIADNPRAYFLNAPNPVPLTDFGAAWDAALAGRVPVKGVENIKAPAVRLPNVRNPFAAPAKKIAGAVRVPGEVTRLPAMAHSAFERAHEKRRGEVLAEKAAIEASRPEAMTRTGNLLLGAERSAAEMLPYMLLGVATRSPNVALSGMEANVSGESYGRYAQDPNLTEDQRLILSGIMGKAERVGEGIVFRQLFGKEVTGTLLERWAKSVLFENIQEQATTIVQDFAEWQVINPEKTAEDWMSERGDRAFDTMVVTTLTAGPVNASVIAADRTLANLRKDKAESEVTVGDTLINELLDKSGEIKLRTRSPEKMAELIDRQVEGSGAETVALDLDGLAQSLGAAGLDITETLTELGVPADAISETAIVMGTVEVPTARLLASEGAQTLRAQIQPHIRLAGEALTPAQKEAVGKEAAKQAARISEDLKADMEANADFADQITEVEETIFKGIQQEGYNARPGELRASARLMSLQMAHAAKRSAAERGEPVDVRAFYEAHGPKFQNQQAAPEADDATVLRQAQDEGYEGADTGEARQWREAVAKGLDMSQAGRMQRAKEMGFDTDEVFYHGTGDLTNFSVGFDPNMTGLGNDQLGSGFYFTNQAETASGYTTRRLPTGESKLGGEDAPGVLPVVLNIKNPIVLENGTDMLSQKVEITAGQAEAIIRQSPLLAEDLDNNPLGNWHDIWSEGVQDWMIGDVASSYEGNTILSIENDFFKGHAEAFRRAVRDVLGYDGVIQKFDSGEVHKVAWFPEQVRSVHAAFDPDASASSDLLAQSIRKVAAMTDEEASQWFVDNVTESRQDMGGTEVIVQLRFETGDAGASPDANLRIQLDTATGIAKADLFLGRSLGKSIDGPEAVPTATRMFSRGIVALRAWAQLESAKAIMFSGASESHDKLYQYMLSTLEIPGYTAYRVANTFGTVTTSPEGEKTGDTMFGASSFILLREGEDINDYAKEEISRGRRTAGAGSEVVNITRVLPMGRRDRRGDGRPDGRGLDAGATDRGRGESRTGDELNQLIGPKAASANPEILKTAQKMAKETVKVGKGLRTKKKPKYTRQQIWDETAKLGQPWYQNDNGEWISEIEDGAIVVNDAKGPLSEVIEFSSITAQYPQLGRMKVDARDPARVRRETGRIESEAVGGWFNPSPLPFGIKIRVVSRGERGEYTATHEIQHAVDDIEGRKMGMKKSYENRDTERRAFNTMYRRLWPMEERIATPPWKTEQEAMDWWRGGRVNAAPPAKFVKEGTFDPAPGPVDPEVSARKAERPEGAIPNAQLDGGFVQGEVEAYEEFDEKRQRVVTRFRNLERSSEMEKLMGRTFLSVRSLAVSMRNNPRLRQMLLGEGPLKLSEVEASAFKAALNGEISALTKLAVDLRAKVEADIDWKVFFGVRGRVDEGQVYEMLAGLDIPLLTAARSRFGIADAIARVTRTGVAEWELEKVVKAEDIPAALRKTLAINPSSGAGQAAIIAFRNLSQAESQKAPKNPARIPQAEIKAAERAIEGKLINLDAPMTEQKPEHYAAIRALWDRETERLGIFENEAGEMEPEYVDFWDSDFWLSQATWDADGVMSRITTLPLDQRSAREVLELLAERSHNESHGGWMEGLLADLRDVGIVGAKYVPGGIKEDGPPSSQSIVIFDERAPVLLTDQSGNLMQERRGSYSPSTRQMNFGEARDASTFMHEGAHWFLDMLEKLAPTEAWAAADLAEVDAWYQSIRNTPKMAEIRARYEAVDLGAGFQVNYKGLPVGRMVATQEEAEAAIEWRERQEAFAETFEQYLMSGKAPVPSLVSVFRQFRDWLVSIYRGMAPGERANLNPQIRDFFDRVLAVDTEVDAASAETFRDAETMAKDMLEKGIITERQYRMVGERLNKAREEVKEEMTARVLDEKMREQTDWWEKERARVKGDLARAFDKSPVGRAYNWLAYGEWKGDIAGEPGTEVASDAELFQSMRDTIRPAAEQQIEHAPQGPSREAMLSDLETLTGMAEALLPTVQSPELADATLRLRQIIEREDGTGNNEFRGQYLSALQALATVAQNVEGGAALASAVTENLETGTGAQAKAMLDYRGISMMQPENIGDPPLLLVKPQMYQGGELFQNRTFNPPGHGAVPPPADLPPIRLNLTIIREQYGEEAVKKLPAAVRRRSSTSSNVTDMLAMIETTRKALSKRKRPKSLFEFIRSRKARSKTGQTADVKQWGIKGAADELKAMDRADLINEENGIPIDTMRELADEAGYIGGSNQNQESTINDLLSAIDREARGEKVYSSQDRAEVEALETAEVWAKWFDDNGVDIYEGDKKALKAKVEALVSATDEALVSPDQAAEMLGFQTGEELLDALSAVGNRDKFLNARTDAAMADEFGDMMNDGTLVDQARETARLDIAFRQTEIEMESLARAVGVQASSNYAKQLARDIIGVRTVKEIAGYERDLDAERRFGKAALRAVEKGDYAEALKAKQRQLVAMHLYREGKKAHERIEKTRKDLLKYYSSEGRRDRIADDYLEQIIGLLDGYELRVSKQGQREQAERQTAKAYVEQMTAEGRESEIAPEAMLLAELADKKTWRGLTQAEVEYLAGAIQNLAHLGRREGDMLRAEEKRKFEAVIFDLVETLEKAPSTRKRGKSFSPGWIEEATIDASEFDAKLTKIPDQLSWLDGQENGALQAALLAPIEKADIRKMSMLRDAIKKVRAILKAMPASDRRAMISRRVATPELKLPTSQNMTLLDVMIIGLNFGNEGNRQALMDGFGWQEQDIQAVLDRYLTDVHWDAIESIWNLIGSYKDEAFGLEKMMTGVAPKAVEGLTFTLKSGRVIKGQYYPLSYDGKQESAAGVKQGKLDEKQMLSEMGFSFTKPQTRHGHLINRVGSGGKPVKVSIDVFYEHIENVIHDIAFRPAVIDTFKIIRDQRFTAAYVAAAGRAQYDRLMPWLHSIATNNRARFSSTFARHMTFFRGGWSIAMMGYKLSTATQQFTGYLEAATEIGPRWMLQGALKTLSMGPASFWREWAFIRERSEYLANRVVTGKDRDVRAIRSKVRPGSAIGDNAFIFLTMMDAIVGAGVWRGAFDKAVAGHVQGIDRNDEEAAAAYADRAVQRSLSAGEVYNLPEIMREGEISALMTMVYSYGSKTYNRQRVRNLRLRYGQIDPATFTASTLIAFLAVPILAALLAGRLWPDDDEDWEDRGDEVGTEILMNAAGAMPFIRDMVSLMARPEYGYQLSPVQSTFEQIGTAARDAAEGKTLDSDYRTKQAVMAFSTIFRLPGSQLWTTGDYIRDVWMGDEDPMEDPADAAREALIRDTR